MPSRLSKLFSSGDKEKEALAEAENNRNSVASTAPPPYEHEHQNIDADNAVPPPDITAGFSNLSITPDEQHCKPVPEECIAHLKLLECFYRLQQKIGSSDGLYGIHDTSVQSLGLQDDETVRLLAKLAEKRWAVFVARAVDRYEAWSDRCFPSTGRPTITDIDTLGSKGLLTTRANIRLDNNATPQQAPLSTDHLPPIDVLLVWHAFMLNPRAYFEDCVRKGKMQMWHHNFPWEIVANSINSETFIYAPSEAATVSFVSLTGYAWENQDDDKGKCFMCTKCDSINFTSWTTINSSCISSRNFEQAQKEVDQALSFGDGYCDLNFRSICHKCSATISSDYLKVGKFCRDLEQLSNEHVPMPGTIFGSKGIPQRVGNNVDLGAQGVLTRTNALFSHRLGEPFLSELLRVNNGSTMEKVRTKIDEALQSKSYLKECLAGSVKILLKAERMAIRRMMSRYWDNSSASTIDLIGAVIRQGSFTEKMHNIDWLHSPALHSTMPRLLTKYTRFVSIMADPFHMAVPTLDVDLAWHTHQLSPASYLHYTVAQTMQFIDHDDKVAEVALNDAFAWTSKQYQKTYGEPYSECTCWYCEATRESHTSAASRLFKTSSARANERLHDVEQDPRKSVHISAHNAVRPKADLDYAMRAEEQVRKLEATYTAACNRAKSKGRKAPKRDDYYYSDAYGYPVYIPAYSPFLGPLPYTPMYYPIAPGCMAITAGSYGNCCSGTCAAGVAAGGCGNAAGMAGCAGGSAGGCSASAGGCASAGGGCGGGGGGGGGCGGGGGGC